MDQQRDFALTQMRKSVEKLGSSAEDFNFLPLCGTENIKGYGDHTLIRFLIARSMEVEKAAKMFVQWQKWRSAMVPNGFISESEIPDELEARKIFLQGLSGDKFPLMISYYPERLAKCYILHMPWFFVSVWKLVSRFLEKATLEKVVIVTNEDETREFVREVGEEVLPEVYGGKAKLVAIQDVELEPMQNGSN
ncbi:hypothetical protein V8G54_013899 [Vigna mungo]|uniref:CRAL-TRIO domain-containing protein n=1 Tax=Vigna mungo TaxID=3915 RepID=A0AAQ3RVG1_VIGMU